MAQKSFTKEQAEALATEWGAYCEAMGDGATVSDFANRKAMPRNTLYHRFNRAKSYGITLADPSAEKSQAEQMADLSGMQVKRVSSYYKEGEIKGQWVIKAPHADEMRKLQEEAIAALSSKIKREKPTKAPAKARDDLASLYVITDFHLGMLSWHEETGADWDTAIAEDLLVSWFAEAIKQAPDSEQGIFCQLGDFLHWDGLEAVTPTSQHVLDADTRFQKVVRVAIRAMRRIVGMLLAKHPKVHVIMAEGNHDPSASVWLREWFRALYEEEPRITVDLSPDPYYCFEWGQTSLFFHHGHKRKPTNVDDVFAAKFREVFGRTKQSFAHMGHLHHQVQLESPLMIVEQHRTLAAPDAYASRGGWVSGRDAKVITYHREYGEVSRVIVSEGMVRGRKE